MTNMEQNMNPEPNINSPLFGCTCLGYYEEYEEKETGRLTGHNYIITMYDPSCLIPIHAYLA